MRTVVLAMFASLDGYINGPGGAFVGPPFSPDLKRHWIDRNMERADLMMYGRVCYEGMVQYWTSPAAAGEQADELAQRDKIVFSRTLDRADWGRVRIVRDNIADEINRLKAQPGKDMLLIGGAGIAGTFLELGLVDELSLLVIPRLLGGGTRLFEKSAPLSLKLIESLPFDSGVLRLTYRRA